MLLSEGATARSPTVSLPRPLETDCQVMPPFVVFQTPPPAAPTYQVLGRGSRLFGTASAVTRPEYAAGPKLR